MTRVVRRRSSAVRNKKLIVTWAETNGGVAEFAFEETEIESVVLFALRYAIKLKKHVRITWRDMTILALDGITLSALPKRQPIESYPIVRIPYLDKKNPKRRRIVRRKK